MKHYIYIQYLVLTIICLPIMAEASVSGDRHTAASDIQPYSEVFMYEAAAPVQIQASGFTLTADSGSLLHDIAINVTIMPLKEGSPLPILMDNVTGIGDGVRLLPNGEHFDSITPARITLSYNPDRIPAGYKADDIYTYYCDSSLLWHRLERVLIDTIAHTITSYTTHFTDFANAVIKVPEMPESTAFVPTAMSDLPDVNPLQGIPMIAVPTANNHGTAEITYPIAIPKGRQGMQPNVDLHYSSAGGNGILGVGWSLSTPAVTLDTRWGVPRYDPNYETEQYMVNGASVLRRGNDGVALALPYQDNSYLPRAAGAIRFYARDTKNQDRVIRYGSDPTNYWWAVTDRNGITTYYGRTFDPQNPNNQTIDEQSVVRTSNDCIAYWAATATIDAFGNYILYGNLNTGNNIYVRHIDYTGNVNQQTAPLYRVHLAYKDRMDIATNGRLGVLQTEEKLLCHVLVQYLTPNRPAEDFTDNLAAYYFQYTSPHDSTLYKSRLAEVIMLDSVHDLILDDVCYIEDILTGNVHRNKLDSILLIEAELNHDMQLYAELQQTFNQPYGQYSIPASTTAFGYAKAPSASTLFKPANALPYFGDLDLSNSRSNSWSVGGSFTVGAGPDFILSTLSGGGNYHYSRSKGEMTTMMMDLNGDGLTDIIYEENGNVYYKRQYKSGSNYAFANPIRVPGLKRLSRETTHTHTWGLQMSLGANLSISQPISNTYTDTYFADVNADGLPDMIDGDSILVNTLVNGVPTFGGFTGVDSQTITVHNSHCGKSIILDGEVDEHIECDLIEVLVDSFPLEQDSVYAQAVERVIDDDESYPAMNYMDGGVIYVDEQEKILDVLDALPNNMPRRTVPKSGIIEPDDSLIYRIENGFVKIYRLEYLCTPVQLDPEIETVRVWVAPESGVVSLIDSIQLFADTSESRMRSLKADGIAYTIQHCRTVSALSDSMHLHAVSYSLMKRGTIEADDHSVYRWDSTFSVQKGDVLMFRLRSGENNRFDKTLWHHRVTYNSGMQIYDSKKDYLCTGDRLFQAVNAGSIRLSIDGTNDDTIPVRLKVYKADTVLTDTVLQHGVIHIQTIQKSVQTGDNISIQLMPSVAEPCWSDIHLFPKLEYISDFETGLTTTPTVHDSLTYYPDIQIQHSSSYQTTSPYRKLFGALHKGWGAFAYQNIRNRDTIILDSLVNSQQLAASQIQNNSSFQTYDPHISYSQGANSDSLIAVANNAFSASGSYNPTSSNSYWVPMCADSRTEQWLAYGNLGCIGKHIHSNAREIILPDTVADILEYDSSIPFVRGETRKNNFVMKQSLSLQTSLSYGAPVFFNESFSFGYYEAIVDYMDMNGDGYPDFVGKGGIQYSTPWGGIGQLIPVKNYNPFYSINTASGVTFSASPAQLEKMVGNSIHSGKFCMNAAMGGSGTSGTSHTKVQYIDINADGLPDKVDVTKDSVWYNLGYAFSEPYSFSGCINEGSSASVSIDASLPSVDLLSPFSICQVSISGGVGGSYSTDRTEHTLADMNGDGLPDQIRVVSGNVEVAYNKGMGTNGIMFDAWKTLPGLTSISDNRTENLSSNIGITGGFTIGGFAKIGIGVQVSPANFSLSQGRVMLTDMNGDGMTDYVWKGEEQTYVRYNATEKANLLTSITNPTGQIIQLDYELSEPSVTHRSRQWNLTQINDIDTHHPMQDGYMSIVDIEYDSAYYDNYEKTDYGYAHVRTAYNYEKVKNEYYHNRSLFQNGELREEWITDSYDKIYIHRIHGGRYKDISTGHSTNNGLSICDDANAIVESEGYFTEYYEQETSPQITTSYSIEYDQYHNIVRYIDEGDISIPFDDWRQEITYLENDAYNMVSLPKSEKIFAGTALLRKSSVNYNTFGKPAHIHFIDTVQNADAVTHLQYDNYGNVTALILPEAANGDYNWTSYEYDAVAHNYVIAMDNPFRVRNQIYYDYRWGLPIRTVDPMSHEMHYTYDYKGRLEKVLSPIELRYERDYTVRYTYNLKNHNLKVSSPYAFSHVCTDMYDSLFTQRVLSLYDARGKFLQKKHYAEVNGTDTLVVDGAEEWDRFGRVIEYGFPFLAHDNPDEYEPITRSPAVVYTTYDILDRPIKQTNDDGTTKNMSYHFKTDKDGILRFWTKLEDENGIFTSVLKSPQDWVVQQEAGDGSITFFEYSPIGELLRTTDADSYSTVYSYDMFGRMLSRLHPDAGLTTWTYDLAGNLIRKQTANLAVSNENIQYLYRYGRLMNIRYPYHRENNVSYLYDQAGRIARRTDGTGMEEFVYDQLGNVAQSIRRIVIPSESNTYIFRSLYNYDSFGRMRKMVYPDGEIVNYQYTTGGLLKNVVGIKDNYLNKYFWELMYDEQGRRIRQNYSNGALTTFTYNPHRQWLDSIHTELSSNCVLQDLKYSYDLVGNIITLDQTANVLSSGLGGTYQNEYTYDLQYRLYKSIGHDTYGYSFDADFSPSGRIGNKLTDSNMPLIGHLLYGYDKSHLTHQPRTIYDIKQKQGLELFWDANGNLAQIVSCKQEAARLHEWDEENRLRFIIGDKNAGFYGYDANGERVYKMTGIFSLNHVNSGSSVAQAVFDDITLYPNPFLVVTPRGYTKHYYAGTERVATVLGGGGFDDMITSMDYITTQEYDSLVVPFNTQYNGQTYDPFYYHHTLSDIVTTEDIEGHELSVLQYTCPALSLEYVTASYQNDMLKSIINQNAFINNLEDHIYFYHGDHLGSANWITDMDGHAVQYIHYAPYGELIANQAPYGYDERYKFTGKERDEESGYDYFGARYYISLLGHWMSVDPLADKYPGISPYAYAAWNPIKFIDPDGKEKHNMMNPNAEDINECYLFEGAVDFIDFKEDSHIYFISHGSTDAMYPYGCEKPMNAEDFVSYLSENSNLWKYTEDKSSLTIVLISCETAKGENPIAQKISELLPETTIIAPTEIVRNFTINDQTKIEGTSESDIREDIRDSSCFGRWNTYKNGELINTSPNGYIRYVYIDNP